MTMNDISQSKLLRPWKWIGRRKRPSIILPHDTLIHILHYFSRKQLVKRYSRVNSSFFHVANRFLPNVHVIKDRNLSFSMPTVPEDKTYVQTFEALTLGKYQKSYTRFKSYTRYKSYTYYKSYTRFEKAMNKITKKRITAEELLKNMPPAFIRFPKFSTSYRPDEVLLKFLRDCKQNFYFWILGYYGWFWVLFLITLNFKPDPSKGAMINADGFVEGYFFGIMHR